MSKIKSAYWDTLTSLEYELLEYLQYAVWAHPELEKNEKLMAVIAKATGKAEQN